MMGDIANHLQVAGTKVIDREGNYVGGYDAVDDNFKVKTTQKKWKDSFNLNTLNNAKWDLVQTGAGMTFNHATAGQMVINAGTAINSETILRSKEFFTVPMRAVFMFSISQRIANQDVIVELVSTDGTTIAFDDKDFAQWRISNDDNATANYAVVGSKTEGVAPTYTTAFGTNTTHTSQAMYEIEIFADEVWYHTRLVDNEAGRQVSKVRNTNTPDPNKLYKAQIRIKNKGTAPASNTAITFTGVTVVDYAELTAEITAGRGNISSAQAMAVNVVNSISTVTTAYVAPKIAFTTDTTTNIAVATPYVSASKDIGTTPLYSLLRIRVFADQPIKIEVFGGTNSTVTSNRIQDTINVPANTMTVINVPICARYYGFRATNTGAVTTTAVEILSALIGL